MKRRTISLLMSLLAIFALTSCGQREKLLFLNWGEYIDENLLDVFEEKYNCEVVMDLGESNEIFYSKVRGGTTVYDVVCPSDYMVEKMYANDMLAEIDFSKLENYDASQFLVGEKSIMNNMEANYPNIHNYYVPYLWGTWGIMYSTNKTGLPEAVTNSGNDYNSLFNRSALPAGTRVAMYDSHQHAYFAACKYLGLDSTKELSQSDLNKIYDLVVDMNFDAWGTDNIKKDIVAGNLDVGFMWTGDFLYYYCEQAALQAITAYTKQDATIDNLDKVIEDLTGPKAEYVASSGKKYSIGFEIFIPDDTIAFSDNLVIPKDAANKDLAHKFIDFMISEESYIDDEYTATPNYDLTYYVCYNTPYLYTSDALVDLKTITYGDEDVECFNEERADGVDVSDTTLYWALYDKAIGISFEKYYPVTQIKGSKLTNFDRKYINKINTVFNNARA